MVKQINVLGTIYQIVLVDPADRRLDGADGRCDFWTKTLWLNNCNNWDDDHKDEYLKSITRHEIVHAALFESGLGYNSNSCDHWAVNEEMVDWIADQGPKIFDIWKQADCF